MEGDLKEIFGALMRDLDGSKISREEGRGFGLRSYR
jgi:hypothetical protein